MSREAAGVSEKLIERSDNIRDMRMRFLHFHEHGLTETGGSKPLHSGIKVCCDATLVRPSEQN